MLRYQDIKTKAYRILDLTSLTVDEFEQLVPPFEAAFVRHMRDWTMEGKRRTGRRYSHTPAARCRHLRIGCCSS
jgi:hypothetical protein